MPPSLPTHRLREPYASAATMGITKRLVFSAWNVVPRSIATLVSYEAERRAFVRDPGVKEQSALLRFAVVDGRPVGMPLLGLLLYPSLTLAAHCDARDLCRERDGDLPTWEEVLEWATVRIRKLLPADIEWADDTRTGDEAWYWAAPVLLDRTLKKSETETWWQQRDLAALWTMGGEQDADAESDDGEAVSEAWVAHVNLARAHAMGERRPAGPAPADLPQVLALAALAGPGVCALRALQALYPQSTTALALRNAAARIAWSFRSLLNRSQSTAIVRAGERNTAYWRLALDYCGGAGLGAVLTEYAHVVRDSAGVHMKAVDEACAEIADAMSDALAVRTASLTVDELGVDESIRRPTLKDVRMPALFAMRFGSDKTEDAKQAVRDSSIRAAFNSPFWPFVLASTSVGQEGLDFHWYCHAVMHWNLPSNPVDLEQREGRIHRFKGHAVRKNVASRWARAALSADSSDVWEAAFAFARGEAEIGDRGLVPYWLYPLQDGAWIERHVALYPMSRDEIQYEALKKALGAYRLVFGQPRQDELLAYLLDRVDPEQLKLLERSLRIDLSPPRTN